MKVSKSVFVTTSFEGIHYYPNAPEEVSFLAAPHRHIFHVKAQLEVFHDDRELEFIIVKRDLEQWVRQDEDLHSASCEMLGEKICRYLMTRWPVPFKQVAFRNIKVEVSEDGENGSVVKMHRRDWNI